MKRIQTNCQVSGHFRATCIGPLTEIHKNDSVLVYRAPFLPNTTLDKESAAFRAESASYQAVSEQRIRSNGNFLVPQSPPDTNDQPLAIVNTRTVFCLSNVNTRTHHFCFSYSGGHARCLHQSHPGDRPNKFASLTESDAIMQQSHSCSKLERTAPR